LRQGFTPGHFSFNAEGGRCERCEGAGVEKLEMYFFEDMYAPCERCEGQRFKPEILAVHHRGKTISEVLSMTVDDARAFFSGTPRLQERLHLLSSIGLGYLRLGQSATTLSGGEAQRLKIAAELVMTGDKHRHGRSQSPDLMYIMDEPTTGLHMDDVKKLLVVLQKLVDAGNTLVVVEHHLDVIKSADWVIDLGPEGGNAGGQIVAEGRPEQVIKNAASVTGRCLAQMLATAGAP
jgi:excinuclease ABC subunit A